MEPFFSIIIPTFNRVELLKNAIQSVLLQSFSDYEVIVVDDGSTDNTSKVIDYVKDPRLRYIYQQNAERSTARNNGILHAKGKFICFLDSDDAYLPTHLESLHRLISEHDGADGMYITSVMRNEFGIMVNVPFEAVSDFQNAVCYILTAKESVIPPRVSISKSILRDIRFDELLNVGEDTDLWVRVVSKYPLFQSADKTVIYVLHENNSTVFANNPFIDQLVTLQKIFRDPALRKMIPMSVRKQKLSRCYLGMAEFHYFKKDYMHMVLHILVSIFYNPVSPSTKNKLFMLYSGLTGYFRYKTSMLRITKTIASQ